MKDNREPNWDCPAGRIVADNSSALVKLRLRAVRPSVAAEQWQKAMNVFD